MRERLQRTQSGYGMGEGIHGNVKKIRSEGCLMHSAAMCF